MDNVDNNTVSGISSKVDLISDEVLLIFNTINLVILATVVALLGIITNIINIAIFIKQGLNDTVNISLLALAVSDLCSLITQEWINILNNPLFFTNVPFVMLDVLHLTAAWPHTSFAKISSWLTVYITLERCLCVVVPLKVKRIITPRVTVCVVVSIFVVMFLTLVPEFATCYLDWKLISDTNKTMLGLHFLPGRDQMAAVSFNISVGTQISSFVAVIFFTGILVMKMDEKSKWRQTTSSYGSTSQETVNRDKKTVKMITLVAIIYCVCFFPMVCAFLAISVETEFILFGLYNNSFLAVWSFAFVLDCINSSVNICVYYNMSSKYRRTFDSLFRQTSMMAIK